MAKIQFNCDLFLSRRLLQFGTGDGLQKSLRTLLGGSRPAPTFPLFFTSDWQVIPLLPDEEKGGRSLSFKNTPNATLRTLCQLGFQRPLGDSCMNMVVFGQTPDELFEAVDEERDGITVMNSSRTEATVFCYGNKDEQCVVFTIHFWDSSHHKNDVFQSRCWVDNVHSIAPSAQRNLVFFVAEQNSLDVFLSIVTWRCESADQVPGHFFDFLTTAPFLLDFDGLLRLFRKILVHQWLCRLSSHDCRAVQAAGERVRLRKPTGLCRWALLLLFYSTESDETAATLLQQLLTDEAKAVKGPQELERTSSLPEVLCSIETMLLGEFIVRKDQLLCRRKLLESASGCSAMPVALELKETSPIHRARIIVRAPAVSYLPRLSTSVLVAIICDHLTERDLRRASSVNRAWFGLLENRKWPCVLKVLVSPDRSPRLAFILEQDFLMVALRLKSWMPHPPDMKPLESSQLLERLLPRDLCDRWLVGNPPSAAYQCPWLAYEYLLSNTLDGDLRSMPSCWKSHAVDALKSWASQTAGIGFLVWLPKRLLGPWLESHGGPPTRITTFDDGGRLLSENAAPSGSSSNTGTLTTLDVPTECVQLAVVFSSHEISQVSWNPSFYPFG